MATARKNETKAFCDDVYSELTAMQLRIGALSGELAMAYGETSEPYNTYKRHLLELSDMITWKLQILSHSCSYDWKGSVENVATGVSVPDQRPEATKGPDFSGGYVGG